MPLTLTVLSFSSTLQTVLSPCHLLYLLRSKSKSVSGAAQVLTLDLPITPARLFSRSPAWKGKRSLMETLHALLIHPRPGQIDEVPRQVGLLIERLPSLPELLVGRFFRSQGEAHTYLLLTTWDPGAGDQLLADDLLETPDHEAAAPKPERAYRLILPALVEGEIEEWFLHYRWGYSRSGWEARSALVIIVSHLDGQESVLQQRWIAGLRTLAGETPLAQMFLARSAPTEEPEATPLFLCYLGCSSDEEVQTVRAHPLYEEILNWLSRFARVRTYEFTPLFPDYRAPA